MPSSPIDRFPLSGSSKSNSFNCSAVPESYEPSEGVKSDMKYFYCPDLLQKTCEKPGILSSYRTSCRRRYTFSGYPDKLLHKKRRRFTTVIRPTKFLLGGNSSDPLNLSGLQNEKSNSQLSSFSPAPSPLPHPSRRSQVQVIIPSNINDPLNLTTEDDIEMTVLTSKTKKRRRHRKGHREDENIEEMDQISPTKEMPPFHLPQVSSETEGTEKEMSESSNDEMSRVDPEFRNSPVKVISHRSFSRSISKDVDDKHLILSKKLRKREVHPVKKHVNVKKYKSNAEKFCYGNHVSKHSNSCRSSDRRDSRLGFLKEAMFCGKDVLDIGCNTGELTMHIAKHWQPRKVLGIDIDQKLISRALRNVKLEENKKIEKEESVKFPKSLSVMFGPLSKLAFTLKMSSTGFPNNIYFLEANYVPACEDSLDTQKPEYDTILCLRVTKWIHLNFGDEGLKMAFKRMYAQMRYGGRLILEPQPWFTYSASKRITSAIKNTYNSLQMRPESFCEYLMAEVGFTSCDVIGRTFHCSKGYRQDIYMLTKGHDNLEKCSQVDSSSIPSHSDTCTPTDTNPDNFTDISIQRETSPVQN